MALYSILSQRNCTTFFNSRECLNKKIRSFNWIFNFKMCRPFFLFLETNFISTRLDLKISRKKKKKKNGALFSRPYEKRDRVIARTGFCVKSSNHFRESDCNKQERVTSCWYHCCRFPFFFLKKKTSFTSLFFSYSWNSWNWEITNK